MSEHIDQRLGSFSAAQRRDLTKLFDAIRTDLTALRTQALAAHVDIDVLRASVVALTAKMDTDFADVTNASTDYAASVNPAAMTVGDPDALTLTT